MVDRCSELLCLKENIWDEIIQDNSKIKIFKRNDKYLAILYDMFYFEEFKELSQKYNFIKIEKEDLEKAKWYIEYRIKDLKSKVK